MIELRSVTKKYADLIAVKDLDLTVSKGEIFGFIGPNGAGKTTTIKILGGVNAPTSGSVFICGINMGINPEKAKSKIGFIPDRPYLYEKLTGMEFLKFVAGLYGMTAADFSRKADEKLGMFSLLDWSHELIESYSHGMKQRLVMSAALLHDPEVLIVDEPTVGLDPSAIKLVKSLFMRLSGEGVTIFMSTHTLGIAEEICHRIGVIHKGSLIATGTPQELIGQSHTTTAGLEEVFIRLTEEHGVC